MKGVQFGTSTAHEQQAGHLHDFFTAVDRGIHTILAKDRQPLILAAVTRELAIYRKVNTYSPVLAGAVHGSPDALGADVLFAKASELMSAYSANATNETLKEIEEARSHGLWVEDPMATIEASRIGRVEELIVSPFAPGFHQHEEAFNGAALATIRNSGRIRLLNASQIKKGFAAIVRFRDTGQYAGETPRYATDSVAHRQ
jgi:hypothetical protein